MPPRRSVALNAKLHSFVDMIPASHNPPGIPGKDVVMGIWSSIKKTVKKAWGAAKAVVRAVARAVFTLLFLGNLWDLFVGFLAWPPKRMRVHIVILRGPSGPLIERDALTAKLGRPIEILKQAYKDHCNVTVRPYAGATKTTSKPG